MRRESVHFSLGSLTTSSLPTDKSTREIGDSSSAISSSTTRTELTVSEQQHPERPIQTRASFSINSGENQAATSSSTQLLSSQHPLQSPTSASGQSIEQAALMAAAETQSIVGAQSASGSGSVRDETESLDTESSETSEGSAPREVGHNLYILSHKLAKFNKELSVLLKSKESEALSYYAAHTAQIEVFSFRLI